jgi:hypothetical protein
MNDIAPCDLPIGRVNPFGKGLLSVAYRVVLESRLGSQAELDVKPRPSLPTSVERARARTSATSSSVQRSKKLPGALPPLQHIGEILPGMLPPGEEQRDIQPIFSPASSTWIRTPRIRPRSKN